MGDPLRAIMCGFFTEDPQKKAAEHLPAKPVDAPPRGHTGESQTRTQERLGTSLSACTTLDQFRPPTKKKRMDPFLSWT